MSREERIFIVMGQCGEYSDTRYWLVRAFQSESAAQKWVTLATKRAKELIAKYDDGAVERGIDRKGNEIVDEYDPHIKTSYTDTVYSYHAVPLNPE